MDRRDVVAHALPLFHVHGLVSGSSGRCAGAAARCTSGRFAPTAVGAALSGDATMLFGVPTMYRRLAEAAEADPGWRRRWAAPGCWCPGRRRCRPPSTHG